MLVSPESMRKDSKEVSLRGFMLGMIDEVDKVKLGATGGPQWLVRLNRSQHSMSRLKIVEVFTFQQYWEHPGTVFVVAESGSEDTPAPVMPAWRYG